MKPFIKAFLKKQQGLFINDLRKELERIYGLQKNNKRITITGFGKIQGKRDENGYTGGI